MKLFYYRRRDGVCNFGDDLNPWIWNQLLPDVFDTDSNSVFVGFGTLLNQQLPERLRQAEKVAIFSTGAGYNAPLKTIPAHWTTYCVRGSLSARQLGLPPHYAIADGAVLLRLLFQPTGEKRSKYAFMPHIHHARFAAAEWQEICDLIGCEYIDPRGSTEQVLNAISQTDALLAEAMHGAIAAHALQVPWIPVITSTRILSFKWIDWCTSIDIPFYPSCITPLSTYPSMIHGIRTGATTLSHWARCLRHDGAWQRLLSPAQEKETVAQQLLHIAQTASPVVSNTDQLDRVTQHLQHRLEQLKADVASGFYS